MDVQKEAHLPLRHDLRDELIRWEEACLTATPDAGVFSIPHHLIKHFKRDLEYAGIKYRGVRWRRGSPVGHRGPAGGAPPPSRG